MAEDAREAAERKAQARVEEMGGAEAARALLRGEQAAVLTTLSQRRRGSRRPRSCRTRSTRAASRSCALRHRAAHAQPRGGSRACLFVYDAAAAARTRTAARLAVYGNVSALEGAAEAEAKEAYLARQPEARGLFNLDFKLYRLAVEEAQSAASPRRAGSRATSSSRRRRANGALRPAPARFARGSRIMFGVVQRLPAGSRRSGPARARRGRRARSPLVLRLHVSAGLAHGADHLVEGHGDGRRRGAPCARR